MRGWCPYNSCWTTEIDENSDMCNCCEEECKYDDDDELEDFDDN